jgi:hypothetical protein
VAYQSKRHGTVAGSAILVIVVLLSVAFSPHIRDYLPRFGSTAEEPAIQALRSRAVHGQAVAQNDLGASYESGEGLGQDDLQAANWYRKAADQGFVIAENNLGRLYARGRGVQRNFTEAMKWFQEAAAHGDIDAMNNVGRLYGEGDGVPQDEVEALKWLYRASVRCRAEDCQEPGWATENRARLAATMTPSQVAEAQRRANLTLSEDERPTWVTSDELALLTSMNIDVRQDLVTKGNYHWRWTAKRRLSVSAFSCPVGSTVDISRTINLVIAPQDLSCQGEQGMRARALKVLPNGSVEPLN